MAGNGKQGNKELAAAALAAGQTKQGAATAANVCVRTVHRWLAEEPDFPAMVAALRKDAIDNTLGSLGAYSREAVETLHDMLESKNEPCRLGASRSILDYALRYKEAGEMEDRIAAIEARLNAANVGGAK